MKIRSNNDVTHSAALMGGTFNRGHNNRGKNMNGNYLGGYNRPYNPGFNRGRYQNDRPWKSNEEWGKDRTDLRQEID